jgi:ribosomal protein S18 acetylase RimI-like enzyme
MEDAASHLHVARADGVPASALIAREHAGDCYLWFVATVPEARGRGLAGELVRHALRESAARGCTTASLESTSMAEALYSRLGFEALGRYGMWELRAS